MIKKEMLFQAEERFREISRKHGMKITPQRTVIYREIASRGDHPPVESIYSSVRKKLPNVSFDTVFRTINSFIEAGLVKPVASNGGVKRYDADTVEHHHLHCVKCGRIDDFYDKTLDAVKVPSGIVNGFKITGKKVIVEGICKKCRK